MIGKRIALGLLAFIIGVIGIVPLFAIGEGTGSGIAAYAADTLIFALVAYWLSRADPGAGPLYAALVCAPVFILSVMGAGSGEAGLSVLMTAVTVGTGYLASRSTPEKPAGPSEGPGEHPSPQG